VVERARIVLRAAAGEPDNEIAQAMGMSLRKVSRWCKRFVALGLPGLEKDAPGKKN
jgi:DNA-directed RNA polymerase specialized sigma24 family protein